MTQLGCVIAASFVICVTTSGCTHSPKSSNSTPRSTELFVDNWSFHLGDLTGGADPALDDSAWRRLDLPHDWSIEGDYKEESDATKRGAFLDGGIGWYRKSFAWDPLWEDKSVRLTLDGVYMNATVFVNGRDRAQQPYGYVGIYVDITDDLIQGNNVVAVRVDNEKLPSGRWYTGSGIYRDVWLTVSEPVRVIENGSFIRSTDVTADRAIVLSSHEVLNPSAQDIIAQANVSIHDSDGKLVAQDTKRVILGAGGLETINNQLTISKPNRWSPDNPALYRVVFDLTVENELIDQYETLTGFRSLEFTVDKGFLINGDALEIQGMCMHHDGGPVGSAVPLDVWRHRFGLLKEMGVNAIRTAHNPFAPEFYRLADEMGLMVMDEAFDGWETEKAVHDYGHYFEEWWEKDLTSFLRRDRNHPSVIMWSIGNEVFDATAETQKMLVDHVKSLDSTRPVTQGRGYMFPHIDIAGFNGHGEFVNGVAEFHEENPEVPVIGTEITHTLHTRGYYKSQTEVRDLIFNYNMLLPNGKPSKRWDGMKDRIHNVPDYTEEEVWPEVSRAYASSFDNNIVRMPIREEVRTARDLPYLLGTFRWTAFDYLGESRGWPARTTNFGVIDLAGLRKGAFYVYKSLWSNKPMVHVEPHWTHPGKEGTQIPVVVYTNLERAELFVNGESVGEKSMTDEMQIVWTVPYEPGEIKVVARDDDGLELTMDRRTAGEVAAIELNLDRDSMPANNRAVTRVEIGLIDSNGVLVPHANNRAVIRVTGGGRLIGIENGDILDIESTKANNRRAFNGQLVALIQSNGQAAPISVTVSSDGLPEQIARIASE